MTDERVANPARGQRCRVYRSRVTVKSPVALQLVHERVNIPEQLSNPTGQYPEADPSAAQHAPQACRIALRALVGGSMVQRRLSTELAVPTTRQEDMGHPSHVWADPEFAQEPLDR